MSGNEFGTGPGEGESEREEDDPSTSVFRREAIAGLVGGGAMAAGLIGGSGPARAARPDQRSDLVDSSALPSPRVPGPADFVVEERGREVVARDHTGAVVHRGSEAGRVIQRAVDDARTGGRVVVRGDFVFTRPIRFTDNVRYEHYGTMYLRMDEGQAGLVIGDATNQIGVSEFYVFGIAGDDRQADAVRIENLIQSVVAVNEIRDCRYGIYCPQVGPDVQMTGLKLVFGAIHRCLKGYYVPDPPSGMKPVLCQGNELFGNVLSMAEHGIRLERGQASGGMIFRGTIDTRGLGGDSSRDYVNDFFDTQLGSVIAGTIGRLDTCQFHRSDVLLSADRGALLSGPGGRFGFFPEEGFERVGPGQLKTESSVAPRRDAGNYGGNFERYDPPTGHDGAMLIAVDRDATPPTVRKYVHASGRWHYRELTGGSGVVDRRDRGTGPR